MGRDAGQVGIPQHEQIDALKQNLQRVILGKEEAIEYLLVAILSGSHILLDDVPGVGKTTLAKAVAHSLKAKFRRIQFTSDLLPADIVGGSIFNPQTGEFTFRPGPIFADILLADEVNRASPRTQSALLEAMTEGQVTIEGVGHALEAPFMVLATQNPIEFHGTFPLPEAQLDRFMLHLDLGYPNANEEREMLFAQQQSHPLDDLSPVMDGADVIALQQAVTRIGVERSVADYIVALVRATREDNRIRLGASPRATLMLFRASQAFALLNRREFVTPDDARHLAVNVLGHRIALDSNARFSGDEKDELVRELVDRVAVPI